MRTRITPNTDTVRSVMFSGLPKTTTTLLNVIDFALKFSNRCILVCRLNIGKYGPRPVYFRLQPLCKYKLTKEKVWRKQFGSEWVKKCFSNKHCVKVVQNRNLFRLYFPAIGLNTKIYRVNLRLRENVDQKKLQIWTLFTQLRCYVKQ